MGKVKLKNLKDPSLIVGAKAAVLINNRREVKRKPLRLGRKANDDFSALIFRRLFGCTFVWRCKGAATLKDNSCKKTGRDDSIIELLAIDFVKDIYSS